VVRLSDLRALPLFPGFSQRLRQRLRSYVSMPKAGHVLREPTRKK
jgi:hypothetical protein